MNYVMTGVQKFIITGITVKFWGISAVLILICAMPLTGGLIFYEGLLCFSLKF